MNVKLKSILHKEQKIQVFSLLFVWNCYFKQWKWMKKSLFLCKQIFMHHQQLWNYFFVFFGAGYWYFRGVFDSGVFQKGPPWLKFWQYWVLTTSLVARLHIFYKILTKNFDKKFKNRRKFPFKSITDTFMLSCYQFRTFIKLFL